MSAQDPGCVRTRRRSIAIEQVIRSRSFLVPTSQAHSHSRLPVRFPKEKARETSAIECQIRGHGCGVVVLKAIEQHITAEQDDCQQTISKIGRRSGPVIAHIRWIPCLGEPTAQLFVVVLASSASTPAAHALASE